MLTVKFEDMLREILSGLHTYIDFAVILFPLLQEHMNDSYGFLFGTYQINFEGILH